MRRFLLVNRLHSLALGLAAPALLTACTTREIPPTVVVFHAGSLARPLRVAIDSFSARTSTPVVTIAAGSLEMARRITDLDDVPDIIALADEVVFPALLMPAEVRWYATFARNRMVIAHGPGARHVTELDTLTWWRVLSRSDVEVGRSDPTLDPAGYRALMALRLAEALYAEPDIARGVLARSPPRNVRPKSSDLIALVQAGDLDYAFVYESSARSAGLRWLPLPAAVNLGDDSRAASYASVSMRVPSTRRGDTIVVRGAPIRYAISIPERARHRAAAEQLMAFLLSPEGIATMRRAGLDAIQPTLVGSGVPATVQRAVDDGGAAGTAP